MVQRYDLDGHDPEESICSWRLNYGIHSGNNVGKFMADARNRVEVKDVVDLTEIDLAGIPIFQFYEKRYSFRGIIRGLRRFFE